MKVLVFGSNGLVGQSLKRSLSKNDAFQCKFSTRHDTDLFSFEETQKTITDLMGNKPELRFEFIREKANLYKEFNL